MEMFSPLGNTQLIVLSGPSQSGKSTMANMYRDILLKYGARAEFARKWIARPARKKEDPNTINVDEIPPNCDIRYTFNGTEYGFDSKEIETMLGIGIFPIVITNDINTLTHFAKKYRPVVQEDSTAVPILKAQFYEVVAQEKTLEEIFEVQKQRHTDLNDDENMASAKKRLISAQDWENKTKNIKTFFDRIENPHFNMVGSPFADFEPGDEMHDIFRDTGFTEFIARSKIEDDIKTFILDYSSIYLKYLQAKAEERYSTADQYEEGLRNVYSLMGSGKSKHLLDKEKEQNNYL